MAYDRDEVLRRVQLDELCDELLGPRKRLGGQRLGDTRTEGGAPEVLRTSDAIYKDGGPSLGF
jgi:hypothetical protein